MTTECYYAMCLHHGIHSGEEGPFCFEPECKATTADIARFASIKRETLTETFAPLEADPNGKKPNEAGAKLDAGKNRLSLVLFGFARALQEVGGVGTYGANKYTDDGWMGVPDGVRRYSDAMLRHLLREATGEARDPDTGLLHAAHTAWNALARLDLMLRDAEKAEARDV